jgi:hypothetical protein
VAVPEIHQHHRFVSVPATPKATGIAQGVSFGMHAERLMSLDHLAFDAVAFVAGATATLSWFGDFARRIEFLRFRSF